MGLRSLVGVVIVALAHGQDENEGCASEASAVLTASAASAQLSEQCGAYAALKTCSAALEAGAHREAIENTITAFGSLEEACASLPVLGTSPMITSHEGHMHLTVEEGKSVTVAGVSVTELADGRSQSVDERIANAVSTAVSTVDATVGVQLDGLQAAVTERAGQLQGSIDALESVRRAHADCNDQGMMYRETTGECERFPGGVRVGNEPSCDATMENTFRVVAGDSPPYSAQIHLCSGGEEKPIVKTEIGTVTFPAVSCTQIKEDLDRDGMFWIKTEEMVTAAEIKCANGVAMGDGSAAFPAASCTALWEHYPMLGGVRKEYHIGGGMVVCDGTVTPDSRVPMNNMIAWYRAEDVSSDGRTWKQFNPKTSFRRNAGYPNLTGQARIPNSPLTKALGGGNGCHNGYANVKGDANSQKIDFGRIVQGRWTLCTTSRYDHGHHGRIFTGSRSNWLHGHWGNRAGVAHYDGWKGGYSPRIGNQNWLIWCATNGNSRSIYYNGPNRAAGGVSSGNQNVVVGLPNHGGERSNYRIGEVIAWNRGMPNGELANMVRYLQDRLDGRV